jgi:hypothetical protein
MYSLVKSISINVVAVVLVVRVNQDWSGNLLKKIVTAFFLKRTIETLKDMVSSYQPS